MSAKYQYKMDLQVLSDKYVINFSQGYAFLK